MKTRILCVCFAILLSLSFPACSGETVQSAAAAGTAEQPDIRAEAPADGSTGYTGTVTAINANTITLDTGTETVSLPLTASTVFYRSMGMGGQRPDKTEERAVRTEQGAESKPSSEQPNGTAPAAPAESTAPSEPRSEERTQADKRERERPETSDEQAAPAAGAAAKDTEKKIPDRNDSQDFHQAGEYVQFLSYEDVRIGDTVTAEVDAEGNVVFVVLTGGKTEQQRPDDRTSDKNGRRKSGNDAPETEDYAAAAEFTVDSAESCADLLSTGKDENAVYVHDGATVSIAASAIARTSTDSSGGDAASFYGIGAAALVTDGALTISDSRISTDAAGGTGVFAYGTGTAYVKNTDIQTKQNTSGGIHVAGGGTLYARDLSVETQGNSSAAIRSDRGSGTMIIDGGTYVSNGTGSPAIYSTAEIAVHNAELLATASEAICIEGKNSIRLFDCHLAGNMQDLEQNDCTWNVILYQSMSGDSEVGTGTFEMIGGTLTAGNGGMFYTTNTASVFLLSQVEITPAKDGEFFLKCTGNSNARGWGAAGNNGADCSFTAIDQALPGDIVWDTLSELDLYLLEGSTLTGSVIREDAGAEQGKGYASLSIDRDSTWIVTGDSVVTMLYAVGDIVDHSGHSVSVIGTDGTVHVQGDSIYTVTVSSYGTEPDFTQASTAGAWSEFEKAMPS